MSEHIFYLIWILLLSFFVGQSSFYRWEMVEGKYEWRCTLPFAVFVVIPLIWNAGHRGYFADTTMYITKFISMPSSLSEISNYMTHVVKDKGFYYVSVWIKSIITQDVEIYLMIFAAFQAFSLAYTYRKYSCNYMFSFFLFIASTDYVSWMYNGLRQFLAVTIIFLATPLILNKKYIRSIIVILIASTFHQSALLMIPIVFLCNGKAWNKKTILMLIGAIAIAAFSGEFLNFMDESLVNTQYSNVVSDATAMGDDGTNPIRVLIYSMPAILSFFKRRELKEIDDKVINFCTNTSVITAGLYLISMVTSGIFIGRLPIYVSLYSYILLPWMIENLFGVNSNIVKYSTIFSYLVFFYVQMHFLWGYI